jgi:hypothetical protein
MKKLIFLSLILVSLCLLNCKKKKIDKHIPPDVTLKSGTKYITGDISLPRQDTVKIGIIAEKTEDDLKSYNASYAYDGATSTTTFYNYYLQSNEYEYYEKDIQIITRNQAGTEKWILSIVDRDGNITQKTILITVQ